MAPRSDDEAAPGPRSVEGEDAARGAFPVYTRTGDGGQTGLRGGERIGKDDLRVEAYGTVDELNACLGVARELARQAQTTTAALGQLCAALERIQHELFSLGSALAVAPALSAQTRSGITAEHTARLEQQMDACSLELAPLATFVVPGGCALNAALHLARTVSRRAERRCVALSRREPVETTNLVYLNRLSDALFVWARWAAAKQGAEETTWRKT